MGGGALIINTLVLLVRLNAYVLNELLTLTFFKQHHDVRQALQIVAYLDTFSRCHYPEMRDFYVLRHKITLYFPL